MWWSKRKILVVCCGLSYKAHGSMVLTFPERLLSGLVLGLFTSVEEIKPFLCPKEEKWRNPTIYHIFSCVFLHKLKAIARLINRMRQGLFSGLRPTGTTQNRSIQLNCLVPPNQDDCVKSACGGSANPQSAPRHWGEPALVLWHGAR